MEAYVDNKIAGKNQARAEEFEDYDKVSSWAKEGATAAISAGVINGDGKNINPLGTITYAESAQIAKNILYKIVE